MGQLHPSASSASLPPDAVRGVARDECVLSAPSSGPVVAHARRGQLSHSAQPQRKAVENARALAPIQLCHLGAPLRVEPEATRQDSEATYRGHPEKSKKHLSRIATGERPHSAYDYSQKSKKQRQHDKSHYAEATRRDSARNEGDSQKQNTEGAHEGQRP